MNEKAIIFGKFDKSMFKDIWRYKLYINYPNIVKDMEIQQFIRF